MKKIICILIALIFIGCMSGSAEDLTKYSDEELAELYYAVAQEMIDRGVSKTANVEPGQYYGGTDIPTGTYLLVIDNTDGDTFINYSYRSMVDRSQTIRGSVTAGSKYQVKLTVYDGDVLYISGSFVLISNPPPAVIFE